MESVSKRYAKAIYEYAIEQKIADQLYDEYKQLVACFFAVPELRAAVANSNLTDKEKAETLAKATLRQIPESRAITMFVLKQKRGEEMQAIAMAYINLYRKEYHITAGELTTAVPLTAEARTCLIDNLQEQAEKLCGSNTLELVETIDENIIGGFVFDFDTYRLNASITAQLQQIKEQLTA